METWITAFFVIGIVWGGVAFFLINAIRSEKNKTKEPD